MKELNFTFTEKEANLILAGLGELPHKLSWELIAKVKQQGDAQLNFTPVIEPEIKQD